MTTVSRVGGMRVFTKPWAEMSSDSEDDDQHQTPKKHPWSQTQANITKSAPAKSLADASSVSAANRAPSLGSIVAAIANSDQAADNVSFTTNKQLNFASWKDLTTPTSVQSAQTPYRVQPHRIHFQDDTVDSVSDIIADDETQTVDAVLSRPSNAFDPELDSSRDGLPLLLKQVKVEPKLNSINEDCNMQTEVALQPVARTISLSGHKRKESALETITPEMTNDVTMQASEAGLKAETNASQSTSSTASTTEEVIHRPNVVKKQKTSKWPPPSLQSQTQTTPAPQQEQVASLEPRRRLNIVLRSSKKSAASHSSTQSSTTTKPEAEVDPVDQAVLEQRLRQRQKQIDLGKRTEGYLRYISMKTKRERASDEPKTPNIHKKCSKRSWDGQVRKWRKQLHAYDDPASVKTDDQEKDEDDQDDDEVDSSQISSPSSPINSQE